MGADRQGWRPSFRRTNPVSVHLSGHASGQILTVSEGMEGRVLYRPDEIDPSAT